MAPNKDWPEGRVDGSRRQKSCICGCHGGDTHGVCLSGPQALGSPSRFCTLIITVAQVLHTNHHSCPGSAHGPSQSPGFCTQTVTVFRVLHTDCHSRPGSAHGLLQSSISSAACLAFPERSPVCQDLAFTGGLEKTFCFKG